jgi:tRNA(Glu) U13 pseudouridine synthase TruD
VTAVLEEEGLVQSDFNVRLVRRVCLVKREREALFAPENVHIEPANKPKSDPADVNIKISFELKVRQYATLVMNAAFAHLGED